MTTAVAHDPELALERERSARIEAAQKERSERGYAVLTFHTARYNARPGFVSTPITARIREIAQDLDAVLQGYGMTLKDVLDS